MARFAARWTAIQNAPDFWAALLMLNPLDAFRVNALFVFEQILAEAANKTPLTGWWIAHAGLWFATVAALWAGCAVALAVLRLNRWEE